MLGEGRHRAGLVGLQGSWICALRPKQLMALVNPVHLPFLSASPLTPCCGLTVTGCLGIGNQCYGACFLLDDKGHTPTTKRQTPFVSFGTAFRSTKGAEMGGISPTASTKIPFICYHSMETEANGSSPSKWQWQKSVRTVRPAMSWPCKGLACTQYHRTPNSPRHAPGHWCPSSCTHKNHLEEILRYGAGMSEPILVRSRVLPQHTPGHAGPPRSISQASLTSPHPQPHTPSGLGLLLGGSTSTPISGPLYPIWTLLADCS